jgi:hypothetical protein
VTSAQKVGILALTGLSGAEWYDFDRLFEAKIKVLAAPSNPYQGLALGEINKCMRRCPR